MQPQSYNTLRDIMWKAVFDRGRATRIQLTAMEFGFSLIQVFLLHLLVNDVPYFANINMFWLCAGQTQFVLSSWMGVMMVCAGIVRTFAASPRISGDEILHLRPLPPSYICENCVSANDLLIPPPTGPTVIPKPPCRRSMRDDLALFILLTRRIWAAQHMPHGMVVVLRHSDIVSGPLPNTKALLQRVIYGFFQAVVLIFLTAILGSTYNSDILVAAVFLISFLALIVISRAYSVYFCSWMERALGHILIEYHTPAQRNAIRTIIAGMPSVSVHNLTTGGNYRAGIPVDPDWRPGTPQSRRSEPESYDLLALRLPEWRPGGSWW